MDAQAHLRSILLSCVHIEFKYRILRMIMTSVMFICSDVAISVKVTGSVTQSNIYAGCIKVHWQNGMRNSYTRVPIAVTKSFCRSRSCWRQRLEMLPPQDPQVKLCQAPPQYIKRWSTSSMRSMMSRLNPGPQDILGFRRTKVGFMTRSVFDSLTLSQFHTKRMEFHATFTTFCKISE
jgi:hypothetical protein